MGTCSWCGTQFPKTRSTRKYCTPRCKTNACLGRKPRRIRAAQVEALYELLERDYRTAGALRAALHAILRPELPRVELDDTVVIPRLD